MKENYNIKLVSRTIGSQKLRRLNFKELTISADPIKKTVSRILEIRGTMPNQEFVLVLITTVAINMRENRYKYK